MLKNKITTIAFSLGLFAFAGVPLASADVVISGNGSGSDNTVRVDKDNSININQSNDTNITNTVNVSNNTGHNSVNGTTGGDVKIDTGDASANVSIKNTAGLNVAHVTGCNDCEGDEHISISGNGSYSDNTIKYDSDKTVNVDQDNDTEIDNTVNVDNNTGHNSVSNSTGGGYWTPKGYHHESGDVTIETGDANANVKIENEAGINKAHVSGCGDCDGNTTLKIHGNGSYSDNSIKYNQDSDVDVDQDNDTDFDNDVNVNNNTGYNDAGKSSHWYPTYWKDDNGYDKHHEKDYDKKHGDDKHVGYKPYDKKDSYGKYDYPLVKKFDGYDKDKHYCDKKDDYKPVVYYPKYKNYGGNTNGDVKIHTGDADSSVKLNNFASTNTFHM